VPVELRPLPLASLGFEAGSHALTGAAVHINGSEYESNMTYQISLPATIEIPEEYLTYGTRYLLISVTLNGQSIGNEFMIFYPGNYNISTNYLVQYYVSLPFNVSAYVNGIKENISSGWYNASTVIIIPSQIINISKGEIYNISETKIIVNSSINVTIPFKLEYYVNVSHPIRALINNVNTTLISGYYTNGTKIIIPKYEYVSNNTRYYIESAEYVIVINSSINININFELQFLITLHYPNGTLTKWVNNGSIIKLPYIIQVSNNERLLLNSTQYYTVNYPITISPYYILQYYATIVYPDGTTSNWYNKGQTITLPEEIEYNGITYKLVGSNEITILSPGTVKPAYSTTVPVSTTSVTTTSVTTSTVTNVSVTLPHSSISVSPPVSTSEVIAIAVIAAAIGIGVVVLVIKK